MKGCLHLTNTRSRAGGEMDETMARLLAASRLPCNVTGGITARPRYQIRLRNQRLLDSAERCFFEPYWGRRLSFLLVSIQERNSAIRATVERRASASSDLWAR